MKIETEWTDPSTPTPAPTNKTFRIIEESHYDVEAGSAKEALAKFLDADDTNEFFSHVENRMVDGEDIE